MARPLQSELHSHGYRPIGLSAALPEEMGMLLDHLNIASSARHGGADFYRGTLEGHEVVLCRSGVGKVQAAQAARMLLDLYRVRSLIWVGAAGSLVRDVTIGDVVISTEVQQYDVDFSKIGYPPGIIPFLSTSVFPADRNLRRTAERAVDGLQADFHAFSGKIVTGDRFVASNAVSEHLRRTFSALCCEAEGGAAGQVFHLSRRPFLVVRGISDLAFRELPSDFDRYLPLAAKSSQIVVRATLALLDRA